MAPETRALYISRDMDTNTINLSTTPLEETMWGEFKVKRADVSRANQHIEYICEQVFRKLFGGFFGLRRGDQFKVVFSMHILEHVSRNGKPVRNG